ncbi:MAG TPA: hypothetical protein ENK60_04320 [Anaerolineae bacterium]|nr:hypothetical protein [Anaerolineae bacterium]
MSAPDPTPRYVACLLRFWEDQEENRWRIMLENIHEPDKRMFESLQELWVYFEHLLAPSSEEQDKKS